MRGRGAWLVVALLAGAVACAAEEPLVAVVQGEKSIRRPLEDDDRGIKLYVETVEDALGRAGVAFARLSDAEVEAGGLKPYRAALFPCTFYLPDLEQLAIERYVAGGGKIVIFYNLPDRLATLLGLRNLGRQAGEGRNEFATIELQKDLLQGLPARVRQDSWSTTRVQPLVPDAQIAGEWLDPDGFRIGMSALVVSPKGAFVGHVLTPIDLANKGRMLLAILGHLVPEVWHEASGAAIAAVPRVGPLTSLDALAARLEAPGVGALQRGFARDALERARTRLAEAEQRAKDGCHAEAVDAAVEAHAEGADAFCLSSPEREHELRAAGIRDAYGIDGRGWKESILRLRDGGFNAVIVSLLWEGQAWYPSEVLPVADEVRTRGDPLAEALYWCRECGLELHVSKVVYKVSRAPEDFVAALRAEGRLQRARDGSEVKWLCPSDPRNAALERAALLEVVRNYAVDGIQLESARYPSEAACFCDGCRERFEEDAGVTVEKWPDDVLREPLKPRFAKWRQDQIANLVRTVAAEARRIRPGVLVSARVGGDLDKDRLAGEDWRSWLQEGILDFACPMVREGVADEALRALVERQADGWGPLYVGVDAAQVKDGPTLVDVLDRARRAGCDGFVCFGSGDPDAAADRVPALARSLAAHATTPPHPAPRAVFGFPPGLKDAPGLAYAEDTLVTAVASLRAEGNYARRVSKASGTLAVETVDGARVATLDSVSSSRRRPTKAPLRLPPGRYRLVVEGKVSLGWFASRPFFTRSRPFEIVAKKAPPPRAR